MERTISEFSRVNGALTLITSDPVSTASDPVSVQVDSSGDYLVALSNGGDPNLKVFSFDSTNTNLLDLAPTLTSTGTDPAAIALMH